MVTFRVVRLLALGGASLALACGEGGAPPGLPAAAPAPQPARRAAASLPRIGLDRLSRPPADFGAGRRNIFEYGAARAPANARGAPAPPPPTTLAEAPVFTPPTPAPVPALSVRYIGALEARGLKVAVLLTDQQEILTGAPGDVVANRLKIVRIGVESVDVQDLGSDAVRRIAMRGN